MLSTNIATLSTYQISSMIEIEVELDSDVLAAEAASNVVSSNQLHGSFPLICLYTS